MASTTKEPTFAGKRIQPATSIRDQVEAAIAASIIFGESEPNAILSVPTLAVQFNVSATPVREAMLNLEKRGMVVALRNIGFRVRSLSAEDIEEIVAVRQLLEPRAMFQLATVFDVSKVEHFRELADQIVRSAEASDVRGYLDADHRFHLSLLEELGNRRLVDIVRDLRSETRVVGLAHLVQTDELMTSALEHQEILRLLAAGDAAGAEAAMTRHIQYIFGGRPATEH